MDPNRAEPIRVLIVDDHPALVWGLERLIDGERPRMQVVACTSDPHQALEFAQKTRPTVVLLDLDLNGFSGVELIPKLLERTDALILIVTGSGSVDTHRRAVLAGARGIVQKSQPAALILKAIEKVAAGELWLDRSLTAEVFAQLTSRQPAPPVDPVQQRIATLTPRERQIVLRLAAQPGAPIKRVAQQLHISESTLRNHLTSVYEKLAVSNRLELLDLAFRHGLMPQDNRA